VRLLWIFFECTVFVLWIYCEYRQYTANLPCIYCSYCVSEKQNRELRPYFGGTFTTVRAISFQSIRISFFLNHPISTHPPFASNFLLLLFYSKFVHNFKKATYWRVYLPQNALPPIYRPIWCGGIYVLYAHYVLSPISRNFKTTRNSEIFTPFEFYFFLLNHGFLPKF
jgi:hypothetical protein